MADDIFMEHPDGTFANALYALTDAIRRLDDLAEHDLWLTLSGQGQGGRLDSYFIVDLPVLGRNIKTGGRDTDLQSVLENGGAELSGLHPTISNDTIALPNSTSQQFAIFLDALFRHYGIRPWDDQDDYAIGAEW